MKLLRDVVVPFGLLLLLGLSQLTVYTQRLHIAKLETMNQTLRTKSEELIAADAELKKSDTNLNGAMEQLKSADADLKSWCTDLARVNNRLMGVVNDRR